MSIHPLWTDDYWLLLLQLYQKKPTGMKPLYSRPLVELSLELHIPPQCLYDQLFRLRKQESPWLRHLWRRYGDNPQRLLRAVRRLRQMSGFGTAGGFFAGTELRETFEKDFRPIVADGQWLDGSGRQVTGVPCEGSPSPTLLTPVMLVMVLDLYFRLTPLTMVADTPEVRELASLLGLSPQVVAEVMDVFQFCDPYLNRADILIHPLLEACQEVWQRYGNDNPQQLAALAAQLSAFFQPARG